jgi:parallel beta-helix repeat protein
MSTTSSARRTSSRAAVAALLLAAAARAGVLHVPGEFPTVADAVAAAQPGDEILIASGTYAETVVLDGLIDLVLRGQGQAVLAGGSALDAALTIQNCTNVTVERLSLQNALGRGAFAVDSTGITLRQVKVEGGTTDGILAGEISSLLLDRCRVTGVEGIGIDLQLAVNCTVNRCTVEDTSGTGIELSDVDGATLERCRVVHAGQHGLNLGQSAPVQHCTASKNVVIEAGIEALRINGTDCVAIDNRLQDAGIGGLGVEGTSDGVLLDGNRVIGGGSGVLIDAANVLLRNSRVLHPAGTGVEWQSGPGVVQDVVVVKPGSDAFDVGGNDGGTLLGCRAVHPGHDGFILQCDGLQIVGNLSSGAAAVGFHVSGDDNVFTDNAAHGSGEGDLADSGSGNLYLGNEFEL